MVSSTAQTWRRRRMKEKRAGRTNKKQRSGTPVFPVHPDGYDANAADAKKPAS